MRKRSANAVVRRERPSQGGADQPVYQKDHNGRGGIGSGRCESDDDWVNLWQVKTHQTVTIATDQIVPLCRSGSGNAARCTNDRSREMLHKQRCKNISRLSALRDIKQLIRLAQAELIHHLQSLLQHLPHRVVPCAQLRVDQMGIVLGGDDLGVAEQPPNHFQRCFA